METIIKSEEEYEDKVGEINHLINKNGRTTEDDELLDKLVSEVEEYENIHYPIPIPDNDSKTDN